MRNELNERIKKAYEKAGVSYKTLSKITGVKTNTLSCWIHDKRTPPDYVVEMTEEKVEKFLKKENEFINKTLYREMFIKKICKINNSNEKIIYEIIRAFDSLPTTNI